MAEAINILLVDDEQRNLDALEAILDEPGYRLLRATDADTALRLLLAHDVAAIVLDIKMPGVSGFELAELIQGTKRFRQIPIVFLTAYLIDNKDIVAGYDAGAVDYLTKPVEPQILRHKIGVFAELFRKTRALAELNDTLEARVRERTAELEKSEAALRLAGEQKDAFLATLAHELRNPLAPLRTGLDLLLRLPDAPASAGKTLAAMNRQLDHMVRLIDDLLDVSRISRGMLELRTERVELAAVVETAIERSRPLIDQRKQTIAARLDRTAVANGDAVRLSQIVANLIHNASKFTPERGELVVELAAETGRAVVRVVDRGVGIPGDQLERVFEMFARVQRAQPRDHGGLGIGLALARRLAELHGGTLTASSPGEGQGATFELSIPALGAATAVPAAVPATAPATAPVPVATAPVAAAKPASNGLEIAVIEDNEDAAETLAAWLEEQGHVVRIARTGPEGVDLVKAQLPDLVLCDIGLPGHDGVEVCRQVRALDIEQPMMVALTGWGMDADRRRTAEAGFDRHLVKPVAIPQLVEVLRAVHRAGSGLGVD
jgi:signal transduction histidine kinase